MMRKSPVESRPERPPQELPWRDGALVLASTLVSIVLSAHFQLNEAFYALTRHGEYLQFDELPIGVMVLLIGLTWLSWKRNRQARRELQARRIAEAALASALTENRQLAKENLRIQESERKHLARELHDETGQYLNAIKLDAVSICENDAVDAAFSANAARAIICSVDHVHGAVSDMIGRLRPAGLDELGLVAAVEHCVDHWQQRLPDLQIGLSLSGDWEDLSEPLNLTIYRLIQEGLTNVYKHARARHVTLVMERDSGVRNGVDELRLIVADDGCGMEPAMRSSRFGLSGMRERVELAGGTFVLQTAPGAGLKFTARLPATAAAND